MLEAQARGHKLHYYTPDKLSLVGGCVVAEATPIAVRDIAGDHFTLGEGGARSVDLAGRWSVVLLRQDPPFDLAYITSTHLLNRCRGRPCVVNDPASVRNAPEKLFV